MLTAVITLSYLVLSSAVALLLARWLDGGALSPAKQSTLGELILSESAVARASTEP
jgi:hypothetical protein